MSKPMLLADFVRLPPAIRGDVVEGLAAAIDVVAERAAPSHRFLRFGWYAAALAAYGGDARTLVVEEDAVPVLALPFVAVGPRMMRIAAIPGSYWPFRSFGLALGASDGAFKIALSVLGRHLNGLRVGPVYDDDPAASALVAAARAQGWVAISRRLGESYTLDVPADTLGQPWPRNSTLRKNRFHEKHLAARGVLDWRSASVADWPAAFAALGTVEETSWIAHATDRTGMKFAADGHLAFWQAAAADPVLAAMFRAGLLTVDVVPAAFSFDLDTGDLRYAIANGYDPRFARQSPGKLLQWRNLAAARDRGVRRVDWGSGDSGYKAVLGAQVGPSIRDWLLLRPGLPALAGRMIGGLWSRSVSQTRR